MNDVELLEVLDWSGNNNETVCITITWVPNGKKVIAKVPYKSRLSACIRAFLRYIDISPCATKVHANRITIEKDKEVYTLMKAYNIGIDKSHILLIIKYISVKNFYLSIL